MYFQPILQKNGDKKISAVTRQILQYMVLNLHTYTSDLASIFFTATSNVSNFFLNRFKMQKGIAENVKFQT